MSHKLQEDEKDEDELVLLITRAILHDPVLLHRITRQLFSSDQVLADLMPKAMEEVMEMRCFEPRAGKKIERNLSWLCGCVVKDDLDTWKQGGIYNQLPEHKVSRLRLVKSVILHLNRCRRCSAFVQVCQIFFIQVVKYVVENPDQARELHRLCTQ